jgi:hypothetical protein
MWLFITTHGENDTGDLFYHYDFETKKSTADIVKHVSYSISTTDFRVHTLIFSGLRLPAHRTSA